VHFVARKCVVLLADFCVVYFTIYNKTINEVEEVFGIKFPCEYVDLMKITNGVEGKIGENSYIAIWQIENIIQYNKGYAVEEFAPGLLIFGSDGGDTIMTP